MVTPVTKRVLITVKAYPNPSKKYGETVCCAGIDIESLEWVRLYPIPFRDLDSSQKFQKYTIVTVRCWKAPDDHRLESYKVDSDSIKIVLTSILRRSGKPERRLFCPLFRPHFAASCKTQQPIGRWGPSSLAISGSRGKSPSWKVNPNVKPATPSFLFLIERRKQ